MPTPLEILLDPATLGVLALYALLFVRERVTPGRPLPQARGWTLFGLLACAVYLMTSADLPLVDMLFGTFHNPREPARETGFWHGASARVLDMVLARDVSKRG